MGLRPFFCFYGGKWRAAPKYPIPEHDTIVEPFAGAAGYSTRYADRKILLVERDPVIAGIWKYLIRAKRSEIESIPNVPNGETVDALCVCEEAKHLVGFWLNKGVSSPRKTPSAWMRQGIRPKSFWGPDVRTIIASQVEHIRHWRVIEGSYEQAPDIEATWFVDPPYQKAGKHYRHSTIDFGKLAAWFDTRRGLAIAPSMQRRLLMRRVLVGVPSVPHERSHHAVAAKRAKGNESSRGGKVSLEAIHVRRSGA